MSSNKVVEFLSLLVIILNIFFFLFAVGVQTLDEEGLVAPSPVIEGEIT